VEEDQTAADHGHGPRNTAIAITSHGQRSSPLAERDAASLLLHEQLHESAIDIRAEFI